MATTTIDRLLTTTQLANALGISRENVRKLSMSYCLPHTMIGNRRRYRLDAVKEWLQLQERATSKE